jgi:RNA polymerase sigma factor (sigma-70 family)
VSGAQNGADVVTESKLESTQEGARILAMTITAEVSTDADLVHAARRQEPGAYGELFRRWYDRSYDVALNILRDREAAADVAQDVFLVGWERLMDLRDPNAFGGWILRATRNRALNRVTRDRHRAMEPIEPHGEGPALPDPDADPALHAERSDQRRLIWTAVAALGERDTSLLDLHLRHGLEPAEIAEELRITPNNASQLLFRLRRKLREAIGAVLLWRDGHPSCPDLAMLLEQSGSFDPQVASTIKRHRRNCNQCLREISRQTNPERLFAAVPFAMAPLLLKERAAAALVQAGVPMAPSTVIGSAPVAAPVPSQGVGRVVTVAGVAVVTLAVVSAVALWPTGPGQQQSAVGERPAPTMPSAVVTTAAPVASDGVNPVGLPVTVPATVPATAPVAATTAPDAGISHAPRKSRPAKVTPTRSPIAPGGDPGQPHGRPGWPAPPPGQGSGRCHGRPLHLPLHLPWHLPWHLSWPGWCGCHWAGWSPNRHVLGACRQNS